MLGGGEGCAVVVVVARSRNIGAAIALSRIQVFFYFRINKCGRREDRRKIARCSATSAAHFTHAKARE